jgi:HEPN domain-containing protein
LNRAHLQQLSSDRIEDAKTLLAASRWSAAYYLSGYAVECALKSCILRRIENTGIIFELKKFAEECWTHDIEALTKKADLDNSRGLEIATNAQFGIYWQRVKDWNEASRYRISTQTTAEELFESVNDPTSGVLPWLKKFW